MKASDTSPLLCHPGAQRLRSQPDRSVNPRVTYSAYSKNLVNYETGNFLLVFIVYVFSFVKYFFAVSS